MKEKIKKNIAKILLLIGIFLPIFSFILASGYLPERGVKDNLDRIKIVIKEGHRTVVKDGSCIIWNNQKSCHDIVKYEGRIEIPFKFITIISLILIFIGLILLIF